MKNNQWKLGIALFLFSALLIGYRLTTIESAPADQSEEARRLTAFDQQILQNASEMIKEGRRTFRFDTFGDQAFWGDTLRLHEAIATVAPRAALGLGLKVDVDALPQSLQQHLRQGKVNLDDPATTLALLKLNAVVGVTGFVNGNTLQSIGIQCALCHSTVDDSLLPGVGQRLDGWANRDLNIGAIIALAPNLQPFVDLLQVVHPTITAAQVRMVLNSWGPGKFDAQLLLDGKAVNPNTGRSAATLIPPAFGLAGVNNHTWTGAWGTASYWNAFVANLEMQGRGTFFDPRLSNVTQFPGAATQFPIAVAKDLGNRRNEPDLVSPKLPALHYYQLSIPAPKPPRGSFNKEAASRGDQLFSGKAKCSTCHVEPTGSEPGWNLHTAEEIGIDAFQADRSPDRRYRTSPLNGLWTHQKGGFFHDGRFPDLLAVVNHYNTFFSLALTPQEKNDLIQYLLSLPDE
jgi:hypothetical protein